MWQLGKTRPELLPDPDPTKTSGSGSATLEQRLTARWIIVAKQQIKREKCSKGLLDVFLWYIYKRGENYLYGRYVCILQKPKSIVGQFPYWPSFVRKKNLIGITYLKYVFLTQDIFAFLVFFSWILIWISSNIPWY